MNKLALLLITIGVVAITAGSFYTISTGKNLRAPAPAMLEAALAGPSGAQYCPTPQYRPDAWVNDFISKIKSFTFDNDQMTYLKQAIPTDSRVFSTAQIVSILGQITFDSSRQVAIQQMTPYIVNLTADNIVSILNMFTYSSSKMSSLQLIAITLNDVSAASKTTIINTFTFSSDQASAKTILDAVAPRNCIYGTISETVAAFVIDVSGSMDYTFNAGGSTISRLSYVKAQLTKTIQDQLKPYQSFNIISFSSGVNKWQSDYVSATPANIASALTYINNLQSNGATNISGGLDAAFSSKADLRGIYLLSDGVPNYGIQTVDAITQYLNNANASRTNKVKVNTISFIVGGTESASDRTLSFSYLNAIASVTGGSFKGINTSN